MVPFTGGRGVCPSQYADVESFLFDSVYVGDVWACYVSSPMGGTHEQYQRVDEATFLCVWASSRLDQLSSGDLFAPP